MMTDHTLIEQLFLKLLFLNNLFKSLFGQQTGNTILEESWNVKIQADDSLQKKKVEVWVRRKDESYVGQL